MEELEFSRILIAAREKYKKNVCVGIAKILCVKTFSFDGEDINSHRFKNLTINGHSIFNVTIDDYNNVHCSFDGKIPVDVMVKFHSLFNDIIERKDTCRHRTGTGLYILYYRKFYQSLTTDEIVTLCEDDLRSPESIDGHFKEWLIGTTYGSQNLSCYPCSSPDEVMKRLAGEKK